MARRSYISLSCLLGWSCARGTSSLSECAKRAARERCALGARSRAPRARELRGLPELRPGDLFEYHWPGSYVDSPGQGEALVKARFDRFQVEAEYATGEGACRVLSAGTVFRLEHAKTRYESEYLVTKLDVRGEQQGAASVHAQQGAVPFS